MELKSEKAFVAIILGIMSLIADIIAITQFIQDIDLFSFSSSQNEFWSFSWIISIVFIVLLSCMSLGFFIYGSSESVKKKLLFIFGAFYIVGSLIIFYQWGYLQIIEDLNFSDFIAILILFIVPTIIGLGSISFASKNYLRFPSYAYGIVTLILLYKLIDKYVVVKGLFQWGFIGEVFILLVGGILFLGLFLFND